MLQVGRVVESLADSQMNPGQKVRQDGGHLKLALIFFQLANVIWLWCKKKKSQAVQKQNNAESTKSLTGLSLKINAIDRYSSFFPIYICHHKQLFILLFLKQDHSQQDHCHSIIYLKHRFMSVCIFPLFILRVITLASRHTAIWMWQNFLN